MQPTNHLDLETIDALVDALAEFKGGVMVVSHDQHMLEKVCHTLWVVGNGKVRPYGGDFKEYKKSIMRKQQSK